MPMPQHMSSIISEEVGESISAMSRHTSCGVKNCPISDSSDAGVAVVDALRRNEVLAGVYGEKYLFVDLGTHTLRDLLGDDGIHGFICLSLKMKTPRKDYLTGCCGILLMEVLL